jgi:RND family efflux transporter MFP subunit
VILLLALAMAGGCRRAAGPETEAASGIVVTTAVARVETLRDVASASGIVVPSVAADMTVYATEPSQVIEVTKKEHDPVAAGDVLVRLEVPSVTQEIAALQLAVSDAMSRAEHAQSELARQQSFLDRGLISRNAFEAARIEASTASSLLGQAKSALDTAQVDQDRSVIRARFAGIVTQVWHAAGDAVRPGTDDPIIRVVDPSRVQVSAQLPVAQLARVVPGQAAQVTAIGGAAAEPAMVALKTDALAAAAPTGEIRLAFINAATMPLDTPVSVELTLDQRTAALVIPAAAVAHDGLGAFVMIAGQDLVAHRRDVRVGLVTAEAAQITSGLTLGDRVVVRGLADVSEGTALTLSR